MRKDRIYNVIIIICNSTAEVSVAYCGCLAGLSGCCNHVTATLYCLEHYFHEGLFEDDKKVVLSIYKRGITPGNVMLMHGQQMR